MSQDSEFQAALDSFGASYLPPTSGIAGAGADICATYNKVRPILAGILPFIKAIPIIGSKAYLALSTLKSVLDMMCPAADSLQSPAVQILTAAGLQGAASLPPDVAATLAQLPPSSLQVLVQAQQQAANAPGSTADDIGHNFF